MGEEEVIEPNLTDNNVENVGGQETPPPDNNVDVQGEVNTDNKTDAEEFDQPPVSKEEQARIFYQKRQAEKDSKKDQNNVLPEDEEAIKKVVESQYGEAITTILSQQQEVIKEKQVADYMNAHPEIKEMGLEKQARSWWSHDTRKHLPFEAIMNEVIGANYQKIMQAGASAANEANAKANQTKPLGSFAKATGTKDYSNMTLEDIRKEQQSNLYGNNN